VPSSDSFNHVLAFDGAAGQEVIGQVERTSGNRGFDYYVSGDLYTADGKDLGYVDFAPKGAGYYGGSTTTLPVTGSYRLVIFEPLPSDATLTLYDRDHAPKDLLNPPENGGGSYCTYSGNTESCVGTASPVLVPLPTQQGTSGLYYGDSSKRSVATTSVP